MRGSTRRTPVSGAGILSLSAGQAKGTGWIPSIAISVALGLISARTFCMVGEACDMLDEGDFKVSYCTVASWVLVVRNNFIMNRALTYTNTMFRIRVCGPKRLARKRLGWWIL